MHCVGPKVYIREDAVGADPATGKGGANCWPTTGFQEAGPWWGSRICTWDAESCMAGFSYRISQWKHAVSHMKMPAIRDSVSYFPWLYSPTIGNDLFPMKEKYSYMAMSLLHWVSRTSNSSCKFGRRVLSLLICSTAIWAPISIPGAAQRSPEFGNIPPR